MKRKYIHIFKKLFFFKSLKIILCSKKLFYKDQLIGMNLLQSKSIQKQILN